MGNEVEVKVGASTAALQRGLQDGQRLIAKFKQDAGRMQFLETDNKVKRNMAGLVTDLSNITSFSGLATVAASRLGDVFKNSLSTGLVLGLGTAFVSMGMEGLAAMKELDASIVQIRENVVGLAGKDLSAAVGQFANFKQQLVEAKKAPIVGGLGDVGQNTRDFFGGIGSMLNGGSFMDGPSKRAEHQFELQKGMLEAQKAITDRARAAADAAELRANGEEAAAEAMELQAKFAQEIAALRSSGVNEDAIAEIQRRQNAQLAEKERKEQEKISAESEKTAKAQAQVGKQRAANALAAFDKQVAEEMMTPAEKAARGHDEADKKRAERRLINRDLQAEDNKRRNRGESGMDARERQGRAAQAQKNLDKARDPGAQSLKNIETILKELQQNVGFV